MNRSLKGASHSKPLFRFARCVVVTTIAVLVFPTGVVVATSWQQPFTNSCAHVAMAAFVGCFPHALGFTGPPNNYSHRSSSNNKRKFAFVSSEQDEKSHELFDDDEALMSSRSVPSDRSRREVLTNSLISAGTLLLSPLLVSAKGTTEAEDKAKILLGYKRLTYLLENWDKETTFCGTQRDPYSGKQVCEKTPLVIQDYMGYKNINDPLFKADKTLRRLEEYVPPSRETDFLDALERWQVTADEAAGMAYTSSWAGPQNPNGGDDAIDYYLDRAKKQVKDARSILAQVIDILDLQQQKS
jgi:hypothetical protein